MVGYQVPPSLLFSASADIIGWSAPKSLWIAVFALGMIYSAFAAWRKELVVTWKALP